jgi:hypothetical protein
MGSDLSEADKKKKINERLNESYININHHVALD